MLLRGRHKRVSRHDAIGPLRQFKKMVQRPIYRGEDHLVSKIKSLEPTKSNRGAPTLLLEERDLEEPALLLEETDMALS